MLTRSNIVNLRVRRRLQCAAAAAICIAAGQVSAHRVSVPGRHALLIGASHYPSLAAARQLQGPVNDVELVRTVLLDKGMVPAERITVLAGWPQDPAARPTRANIEREFARLATVARRGDRVMVLFAGHGSQQPDDDPPGTDETDGMDEILLPADAAGWDGRTPRVSNAITDDEVGRWVTAIRNRGAFVWVVVDACQSNTATRGSLERERWVPPEELIPDVRSRTQDRTPGAERSLLGLSGEAGGIAALYAAQTYEATPEKPLPDSTGRVHGLFTYTLMEVLGQSVTPITYRELGERVIARYRSLNRAGPVPGFEGGGLDQPVFGANEWASRSTLLLGDSTATGIELRAGSVHGLTSGSVLAVFPPGGSPRTDTPLGHVKVREVRPASSLVEPVAFGGQPAPPLDRLLPGSRCDVVLYDLGAHVVKVALDAGIATIPRGVTDALERLSALTSGLAEHAPSLAEADWVVRMVAGDVALAPASGWVPDPSHAPGGEDTPFRVGPADGADLGPRLADMLRRISLVRNLLQIASSPALADTGVQIDLEMIRYRDGGDRGGAPVRTAGLVTLHPGEQVAFRVRNGGRAAVDVTLLHLDPHYQITALFPLQDREAENRLNGGTEYVTERFDVTDISLGWEQVIAIAVVARATRVDFRALEQPPLSVFERTRAAAAEGGTPATPLQQILKRSIFERGQTRSLARAEAGEYAIRMLAWRTERGTR